LEIPLQEQRRYSSEPRQRNEPEMDFQTGSAAIGITAGTCKREKVGAVMGGIIGGVIANKTSSGKHKAFKTLVGTIFGAVIGKEVGKNMDNEDAACTHQALERARDGQAISWNNPDTGQRYQVTPYQTYQRKDGSYCRKYDALIGEKNYRETACRTEQGDWQRER
jgi:surface antigen